MYICGVESTLHIPNHKTTKFHTSLTFCTFTKMLHKIDNFKIMYCVFGALRVI